MEGDEIKLLLINLGESRQDYIIHKCIKNGVTVFASDNTTEIHSILSSQRVTHIMIDPIGRKTDWLEFLSQIRGSEGGVNYKIIITTARKDKEFIARLLKLGIVGFIPSLITDDAVFERLDAIVKISAYGKENRRHFRVKVKSGISKVNFSVPGSGKVVSGELTDISIVALALRLEKPEDFEDVAVGKVMDKVQLKINNKFATFSMKILKSGPHTVGALTEIQDNSLFVISNFIYEEMLKEITSASRAKIG